MSESHDTAAGHSAPLVCLACLILLVAASTLSVRAAGTQRGAAPNATKVKKCKYVKKVIHGKKRRVKVCKTVTVTKKHPTPRPTATPTPRPSPSPTPRPSFPVTSASLKSKGGVNVEPGMRPWRYNGPQPDSWWCTDGVDCLIDPNNPYQVQGITVMIDQEMKLAASLGIATIRVEFDWPLIETSRGVYNWSRADYIVREAVKYGLQLQPVLVYTPQWASSDPSGTDWYEVPPAQNSDWTGFVSTIVHRYKNCVHYWELWNEPDGGGYWWSNAGSGLQQFAQAIASPGYQAVKSADPSAQVIIGTYYADTSWWSGLVSDGAGHAFDIAATHDYSNTVLTSVQTMQSWLTSEGMGSKPIWIGEYGLDQGSNTTSDTQHTQLIQTVLGGTGYQQAQYYTLRDELPRSCCPISGAESRYLGLVQHNDVTQKEGFTVMQNLLQP